MNITGGNPVAMDYISTIKANQLSLIKRKFSDSCIAGMSAEVTRAEIHKVLFSMNPNKALGPDGF